MREPFVAPSLLGIGSTIDIGILRYKCKNGRSHIGHQDNLQCCRPNLLCWGEGCFLVLSNNMGGEGAIMRLCMHQVTLRSCRTDAELRDYAGQPQPNAVPHRLMTSFYLRNRKWRNKFLVNSLWDL